MNLSAPERDAIRRRIQMAKKHADDGYRRLCARAEKLYEGQHYEDLKSRREYDRIVVNFVKGVVETKVASMAFSDPDFYIRPVSTRGEENLWRTRAVLTWEWRRNRATQTLRAVLRDRERLGLGIARARWKFVVRTGSGPMPRGTELIAGGRPRIAGEEDPTENAGDVLGEAPVARSSVRVDEPTIERIRPSAFWVAPETGSDLRDAAFCGYTVVRPIREVKRDARLKNTSKLVGTTDPLSDLLPDDYRVLTPDRTPADLRRIALHVYYEWERELCAIFCDEQHLPLWVGHWDSPSGEYPFRVTRSESNDDEFYPRPPLLDLEHPQREINHARSAIARHVRQANGKYQTTAPLTPQNRSQLRSDKTLGIVEWEGSGEIKAVPAIPIPPDLWNGESLAKQDIGVLAALSDYQLFRPPSKRTTTDEVAAIQGAGQPRAQMARADFEDLVAGLGSDMLALLQTYATYQRTLPVFDRAGTPSTITEYRKDEIAGDYLVEVYVGSTRAPERERIVEQLGFIMQSMPNLVQAIALADSQGINLRPFVRYMLQTAAPDVRDVETLIPDAPQGPGALGAPGLGAPALTPGLPQGGDPAALPPGGPGGELDLNELLASFSPEELDALLATTGGAL